MFPRASNARARGRMSSGLCWDDTAREGRHRSPRSRGHARWVDARADQGRCQQSRLPRPDVLRPGAAQGVLPPPGRPSRPSRHGVRLPRVRLGQRSAVRAPAARPRRRRGPRPLRVDRGPPSDRGRRRARGGAGRRCPLRRAQPPPRATRSRAPGSGLGGMLHIGGASGADRSAPGAARDRPGARGARVRSGRTRFLLVACPSGPAGHRGRARSGPGPRAPAGRALPLTGRLGLPQRAGADRPERSASSTSNMPVGTTRRR